MAAKPAKVNLKIYQGSTFSQNLKWESGTKAYAEILSIDKSAPAVIQTLNPVSMPSNWRCWVSGVKGMKEINSEEFYLCTDVSGTQVTINALDSSGFSEYQSGGILSWYVPVDLSVYTGARLQIRKTLASAEVLHEATAGDGGGIEIRPDVGEVVITIEHTATQNFDFSSAVYSLEVYNDSEVVTLCSGLVTLQKEVTR